MKRALAFLVERGRETSTWIGVLGASATLGGINLAPEKATAIGTLGALFCSLVAALTPERKKEPDQ